MSGPAIVSAGRDAVLDRLGREHFDCVVIGGGITGAGLALEASRRGLSVALLEAADFASGSSSRSSKLIHGGLRYLAMGDIALVRSTARERKEIHRIAPHLAEPRWMVVPTRSRAGLLKLRAGITTYEKLGAVEKADLHHNWGAEEIAREEPALNRERYRYACAYREYLTDDARLVLANLRGAAGHGAAVLNHTPVDRIVLEGDIATAVEAECRESGRRVTVRARCVINAAGPWVEAVRRLADSSAPDFLLLSKGIHVVVPAERLPVNHVVLCNTADRRSMFVIRRGPVVYLGTTDTVYERGRDLWPRIERRDVEYVLEPVERYFNVEPIRPDEVVSAWAGLRPLIAEPGKKPSEISRKDEVMVGAGRVVTIAGGKLTGYRAMARETLEKAAAVCNLSLAPVDGQEPLPGGDFEGDLESLASGLQRAHGLEAPSAIRLARLYGSEADQVVELGRAPVASDSKILAGEIEWAVRMEAAACLEDVIYRRTRVALYDPEPRDSSLGPVADRLAELLSWSPERKEDEIQGVRRRLAEDLMFHEDAPAG